MAGAPGSLEQLRTERMTGERLRAGDAAALGLILQDPRVARTIFPAGPPSDAELKAILARHVRHWDDNGFGLWLLRDVADRSVVGRGGLLNQSILGRNEVEVGWAIVPERWGRGLATELARAAIRLAWDALGLEELISFTLVDNVASRRVMEKSGFALEREFEHVGLPHVLYRLRRPADGSGGSGVGGSRPHR